MPYREKLSAATAEDPQQLLIIWRDERTYRLGKTLSYAGIALSLLAAVADFIWSAPAVVATDLLLLFGCLLSLFWIRARTRPMYYWWPAFWAFWLSIMPSLWTTGGLNSPFFGISLAALYVVGAVMDTQNRSYKYLLFILIHIPAFYILDFYFDFAASPAPPSSLTGIVIGITFLVFFLCIHGTLRTERELALEFSEHYRNLANTEYELKQRESQLREAQSIARIGSWDWDLKADKILWSDELYRIFEVKKENFDHSFKAYIKRLHPDLRDKILQVIEKSTETGEEFVFENKVETSLGERFILSRGRTIKDRSGETIKMLGTSQDITDRKHIESQLMQARNQLEKRVEERTLQLAQSLEREKAAKELAENANQAKMQFLANMSHEIRTPMNSILGFSELLSAGEYSPADGKEYVARIRGNGAHLLHLIDDILDLSKFEAGQIPIHKSMFSLKSLVANVISSFSPVLKTKGLNLKLDFQVEDSLQILTDAHRISQILTNLLSNAIKFSDVGTVKLLVRSEPSDSDEKINIWFEVEDTGIGISEVNQKNLFQPFSQADSSIARKFGGSGLGLALSRRIAEALGGRLELKKSIPAKGSHFWAHIPIDRFTVNAANKHKPTHLVDQDAGQLQDKLILLAEDSPDNAFLITHYIRSLGAVIDVATDGLQAVQLAQQKDYDCILMDIQMPGMDGLQATRQIRSLGYVKPIIALTAHALPAETARSLEAGCNLHLTKPINKAELIGALSEQLSQPK